jgi:hypothetical protein
MCSVNEIISGHNDGQLKPKVTLQRRWTSERYQYDRPGAIGSRARF